MLRQGERTNFFIAAFFILAISTRENESASISDSGERLYDVHMTAAQMEFTNPEFVGPGSYMRLSRKSRATPPVMNAFFPLLKDLPMDVNSSWICYQKTNNKWRESLIKGGLPFCDVLQSPIKAYRVFYNYSDFPKQCPVIKGNYSITDFKFDTSQLPPSVFGSEWKVRNWWTSGGTPVLTMSFEMKIDHSKALRKKKGHHQ